MIKFTHATNEHGVKRLKQQHIAGPAQALTLSISIKLKVLCKRDERAANDANVVAECDASQGPDHCRFLLKGEVVPWVLFRRSATQRLFAVLDRRSHRFKKALALRASATQSTSLRRRPPGEPKARSKGDHRRTI